MTDTPANVTDLPDALRREAERLNPELRAQLLALVEAFGIGLDDDETRWKPRRIGDAAQIRDTS